MAFCFEFEESQGPQNVPKCTISDWPKAYSQFSKSVLVTLSSCRLYNTTLCQIRPRCMISSGNHVMSRFVFLSVSEDQKHVKHVQCMIKQLSDSICVMSRIIKVSQNPHPIIVYNPGWSTGFRTTRPRKRINYVPRTLVSGQIKNTGSYVVSQDIYWFETIYGKRLHKRTNQRSNHYMLKGGGGVTGNTTYLGKKYAISGSKLEPAIYRHVGLVHKISFEKSNGQIFDIKKSFQKSIEEDKNQNIIILVILLEHR